MLDARISHASGEVGDTSDSFGKTRKEVATRPLTETRQQIIAKLATGLARDEVVRFSDAKGDNFALIPPSMSNALLYKGGLAVTELSRDKVGGLELPKMGAAVQIYDTSACRAVGGSWAMESRFAVATVVRQEDCNRLIAQNAKLLGGYTRHCLTNAATAG